ncbi:MAG: 4Fe-4S dicluster domain-containing protein, partial [Chitinivibrionales bacterium]|nr:4Fe-4S dicluster domain-containing protein [Chitinivibrionales bacterium]
VHKIYLACANHDHGTKVKKYCTVGCTACTLCVGASPAGAIAMQDNLPVLDYGRQENFVVAAHKCPSNCFVDLVRARPKVNIDVKCNGCGVCLSICPVGAIGGQKGQRHVVDKERCIGCGVCLNVCAPRAIALWGGLVYSNAQQPR